MANFRDHMLVIATLNIFYLAGCAAHDARQGKVHDPAWTMEDDGYYFDTESFALGDEGEPFPEMETDYDSLFREIETQERLEFEKIADADPTLEKQTFFVAVPVVTIVDSPDGSGKAKQVFIEGQSFTGVVQGDWVEIGEDLYAPLKDLRTDEPKAPESTEIARRPE